jgi:hypothetical protein
VDKVWSIEGKTKLYCDSLVTRLSQKIDIQKIVEAITNGVESQSFIEQELSL